MNVIHVKTGLMLNDLQTVEVSILRKFIHIYKVYLDNCNAIWVRISSFIANIL